MNIEMKVMLISKYKHYFKRKFINIFTHTFIVAQIIRSLNSLLWKLRYKVQIANTKYILFHTW